GVLVEPRGSVEEAYATGRGSFRLRARWETEILKHGQYQVVVTEIPYQVQKGKLVERVAELLNARKLSMLANIRDESAEDIRIVLEPKSRSIEPEMLMEGMFRHTDLETRFGLNMNVLDGGRIPKVMNLREVLNSYLNHRHEVLKRRTRYRLDRIDHRLEVLGAYLIAYANLDEIIRIIREEDEPKRVMMKKWKMSNVQAEAILNMRLRALRRLEEIEIQSEHGALSAEKQDLNRLMKDEKKRWAKIGGEIKDIQARFGNKSDLGRRRTEIGDAPTVIDVPLEVMIEREPITIICSEKGWIRAARGHVAGNGEIKYKEGDRARFVMQAETTDKLLVFGTNGRFYTIGCDGLPGGRGFGDPIRLLTGLGNDQDIVSVMIHKPGRKLLVAANDGRGFVVSEDDVLAQTKGGKQVLNVKGGVEAQSCAVADGDSIAVVGENRKLLIFPFDELPVMSRGRGVVLQRYKDSGLSDATVFTLAEGLTWRAGERSRTETDLLAWIGKRAQAGRIAPRGFSSANRFR
ncbi:MAG: DNA gyrase subunit A, partial [Pseudomonadota bacterium]|nr:DNA gyrase subunit A [Pseudomonadota bacterium]